MSIETNQQSIKKDFTNLSKQDIEMLLQGVKENSTNLFVLQEKFDNITKEFCEQAVKNNAFNFEYVPNKFITEKMCQEVLEDNSSMFQDVPKKFITEKMCQKAVKDDSDRFEYVPKKFKSFVSRLKRFDDIINF